MKNDISYLMGKFLLRRELPLNEEEIAELLTNECISRVAAIQKIKKRLTCTRCHNQKAHLFSSHYCITCRKHCEYCRHCLSLGKVKSCDFLYFWNGPTQQRVKQNHTLNWSGQLSRGQQVASNAIVETIKGFQKHLIWAVCGAGKTEMIFHGIEKAFENGLRVLLATPRTDVVKELEPRFRQVFPSIEIAALYGGSKDKDRNASFVLATTHQVLRYKEAFDVVIVDEVDAFPYNYDQSLKYAVERAKKERAALILLSATPERRLVNQYGNYLTKIPRRFHGHALPVPTMNWVGDWKKQIRRQKLPKKLHEWLTIHEQPILLFVPTIYYLEKVSNALNRNDIKHQAVHASSKNRHHAVDDFRKGLCSVLVTTTILERGITISNVAVAILGAENEVFNEAALVQISGRVGRDPQYPNGDICYFHYGKTRAMVRSVKQIQEMNQEKI
ncbi:DEAD/DEAH box helicase [Alkalihalobacillus trypoxylicola]|uniref:Competence protein ComF n=1 Tax=Alkalihalobacillus trypoxylicola TaxID=519424 RepID=A0A161PIW7_9BACI|nr:DEAD/DEAH box helicase [Alkalihalobacillus trypoxylicola]KYG33690.1 hypothetical protein AZF04_15815 [Alkalihalobacillus trypoxylicola]